MACSNFTATVIGEGRFSASVKVSSSTFRSAAVGCSAFSAYVVCTVNPKDGYSFDFVAHYLYEASYYFLDYAFAKQYYESNKIPTEPFGCSSVRNGNWYGRNFDWFYDNGVTVVVRTKANNARHAVIGVCSGLEGLTDDLISSCEYSDLYRILPFAIKDGVNDAGLFCNINVVHSDYGTTIATEPLIEKREEVCSRMLPRYILDRFDNALEAIEYIRDYVSVYNAKDLKDMEYEIHFMVGDADSTYVVEFIDGEVRYRELSIMANFYVDGVTFNEDGSVYTPTDAEDGHYASSQGITANGAGLERHNIINEGFDGLTSKEAMRAMMNSIMYTNAYDPSQRWCSEFTGIIDGMTVDTPSSEYEGILLVAQQKFIERDRNMPKTEPRTWQTTHSCVYDLQSKRLHIVVQEDTEHEYDFRLKETYTSEEVDAIVSSLERRINELEF